MRIKSSVEFILPNIIFSLSKNETTLYYAFRLSRLATVVLFFLSIGLISSLLYAIDERELSEGFATILIFFLLFLGLILAELRLTQFKIKKLLEQ